MAGNNSNGERCEEPEFLRIRNWERYQLYEDGRKMLFFAVFVTTHTLTKGPKAGTERTGIFDDPEFMELADAFDCPVFRLMAVAAQTGNKLRNSEKWLKHRCHTEKPVNIAQLLASGFLEPHPESCTSVYSLVLKKEKEKVLTPGEELTTTNRSWFRRLG